MPLSKARMQARKRYDRAVKPASNPNPVKPAGSMEDNYLRVDKVIIGVPEGSDVPDYIPTPEAFVQPKQVRKLVSGTYEMVNIQVMDADGNPVPEFT